MNKTERKKPKVNFIKKNVYFSSEGINYNRNIILLIIYEYHCKVAS